MNPPVRRLPVTAVAVAVLAVALVGGCTRHIDDATPTPAALAAPITALQVVDLLSPEVLGEDGNLFVTAEPERCSGLAQEVDPPFLDAHRPLATDGGHWTTEDGAVFVEEMVAVYRFDFDPAAALADARRTIDTCRGTPLTVTTMQDRTYRFDVGDAGESPQASVVWALRAADWNCDNTFVAAHNAAIEITACGAAGGFDVVALAEDALARIDLLANTTT
ncbi:sensor domain-containing protein [Mycobacterium sp. DL]|uniref:sensor domain-containing protein n=1 Tax=Mycobacteriaceae TaxID=1762 RepID=UPI00321B57EB